MRNAPLAEQFRFKGRPPRMEPGEIARLRKLLEACDGPMDMWLGWELAPIWSIELALQAYYFPDLMVGEPIYRRDLL